MARRTRGRQIIAAAVAAGLVGLIVTAVLVSGRAGGPNAGTSASLAARSSIPGSTVAPDGVLGEVPAGMALPEPPPGPPPGPAPDGGSTPGSDEAATLVGAESDLKAVPDAEDPTDVLYTLSTADPFRFSAADYLTSFTSDKARDDPLVTTWGLVGGSLRAWRAVDGTDPALWLGLMVLEYPTSDAAAGALSHLATRGRGAVDSITRFEVPGVENAIGLGYVEYPRADGAPLPGETVVFQRGRYMALVMTSGSRPSERRATLEAVAREVEPEVAALD